MFKKIIALFIIASSVSAFGVAQANQAADDCYKYHADNNKYFSCLKEVEQQECKLDQADRQSHYELFKLQHNQAYEWIEKSCVRRYVYTKHGLRMYNETCNARNKPEFLIITPEKWTEDGMTTTTLSLSVAAEVNQTNTELIKNQTCHDIKNIKVTCVPISHWPGKKCTKDSHVDDGLSGAIRNL